jgi:uncharacterized repeat protein (TIGR01451 family)
VAKPPIGLSAGAARRGAARRERRADYVGDARHGGRRLARSASTFALCVIASVGSAQPSSDRTRSSLELATRVEKIVAADGTSAAPRTQLKPVEVATPGDELVLTVTFQNVTSETLDGVRITQPIPPNMRYVDGSAIGPGSEVLYSVDGGVSYGQPNELKVVAADGTRRAATADDYTHVRWLLKAPLEPGARGFARFRAIVRAAPPPSAP